MYRFRVPHNLDRKYRFRSDVKPEVNFNLAIKIHDDSMKAMVCGRTGFKDLNREHQKIKDNLKSDLHSVVIISLMGMEITKEMDKMIEDRLGFADYRELLEFPIKHHYIKPGLQFFWPNERADTSFWHGED